jgi:hypothetical protein
VRKLLAKIALLGGLLTSTAVIAQAPLWQLANSPAARGTVESVTKAYFNADSTALRQLLENAPREHSGDLSYVISLPLPDGSQAQFSIIESPIMADALAAKFPDIKTYKIFGIDDPGASGRVDISASGFRAMLDTAQGRVTIDPSGSFYQVQARSAGINNGAFQCQNEEQVSSQTSSNSVFAARGSIAQRVSNSYQVYRLAVSATRQYVNYFGGTLNAAMTEIMTAINRVNYVLERDLGIRLVLIGDNELLIDVDNIAGFTNNDPSQLVQQNQAWADLRVGAANYDIGHVFSTGNGGLAQLGTVCNLYAKGRGTTGLGNPTGGVFYIDYVAHEIGHQFDADHSFNGSTSACSVGRVGSSAFEPGSGSTIMSYSGICSTENIQNLSDANFHSESIAQIHAYTSAGGSCYALDDASNPGEPFAGAGNDYIIPKGTPFQLTGSGSDADGDTLSYQWDQIDLGSATSAATFGTDLGDNSLFRSFPPQPSAGRDFPALGTQVDGLTDLSEALPCTSCFGIIQEPRNFIFPLRGCEACTIVLKHRLQSVLPFSIDKLQINNNPTATA